MNKVDDLTDILRPVVQYERELIEKLAYTLSDDEINAIWLMVVRIKTYNLTSNYKPRTETYRPGTET